jgi:hypothetical protein
VSSRGTTQGLVVNGKITVSSGRSASSVEFMRKNAKEIAWILIRRRLRSRWAILHRQISSSCVRN